MLNLKFCNPSRYTPFITPLRWKVRILPKERYDDDENIYMPRPKPKKSHFMDIFSLLHREKWSFSTILYHYKWKSFQAMKDDQRFVDLPQK